MDPKQNPLRWVGKGIRWLAWTFANRATQQRTPPDYIYFLFDHGLPEFAPPRTQWWQRFIPQQPGSTLDALGDQFDRIARDTRVKGIILHLRALPMPLASLQTLRDLMLKVRASGKRVVVWTPMLDTGLLYVATAADQLLLQPGGGVMPLGISRDYLFFKDTLSEIGVEMEAVRVSPFKSGPEPLTQTEFSPEARDMATWLVDDTYDEIVRAIANGRGMSEEDARALIDNAPYTDEQAVANRVVDGLVSEEALPRLLGTEETPATIEMWNEAQKALPLLPLVDAEKYIAMIRVEGLIVPGHSRRVPRLPIPLPLAGDDQSGDITVVQTIRAAMEDERAAGVLLWVDSSGGSATASETMAAALDKLGEKKPIVAAFGAVAASGGYYVATPAKWIVAQPGTVTGSIGVFTLKGVVSELLNKLKIGREKISRGKNVALYDGDRKLSEEDEAIIKAGVQRTYDLFVDRVAKSRKMSHDAVNEVAEGRVWTGRQAKERGLVDELGGWRVAWHKVCNLADVPETTPLVEIIPPREFIPPK